MRILDEEKKAAEVLKKLGFDVRWMIAQLQFDVNGKVGHLPRPMEVYKALLAATGKSAEELLTDSQKPTLLLEVTIPEAWAVLSAGSIAEESEEFDKSNEGPQLDWAMSRLWRLMQEQLFDNMDDTERETFNEVGRKFGLTL